MDTSESLILLASKQKLRDCYILSRTLFENIVNACFIFANGDEAAERAIQHWMQKSYRDLHRGLQNDQPVTVPLRPVPVGVPGLAEAVARFTSKKGREITGWTPETVAEQVDSVCAQSDSSAAVLKHALAAIYRHASDISHGTFFGAMFALGFTINRKAWRSPDEMSNDYWSRIAMLEMLLGLSLHALVRILGASLDLTDDVALSGKLVDEIRQEPYFRGAGNQAPTA